MEVIYYFQDLKKSLDYVHSMLVDEGILLIKCHQGLSRWYRDHSYFSRYGDHVQGIPTLQSMRYCLSNAGFEIVRISALHAADLLFFPFSALPRGKIRRFFNSVINRLRIDIAHADRLLFVARKK